MAAVFALFFVALVLMLGAVLSVMRARRMEQIARVNQRLENLAFMGGHDALKPTVESEALDALSRWLQRVGIPITPVTAVMVLVFVLVGGFVLLNAMGTLAACAWWITMGVVIVLIPQVRYRQKINKLIAQVPLFIDQVIRGLTTGRNVEGAIKLAAEDLKEPLRDVIMRAQKGVELGMDLGDAMRDAADFHDVRELHMLALAIHTSRVYGGSPRDMLESIVKLIRQREQIRRELMAMTGETRMTAWVMGSMPSLLGGYMFMVSPDYILEMWHDPSGQRMLIIAISMQILGALAFWRLIKSI